MVIIISGASHTGKTKLAQQLLEQKKWPTFSLDHLKMGLIRSQQTDLTVYDDQKLTEYLWPIVKEMIKTVIENHQNLIVEGLYIPFDFQDDFNDEYLKHIKHVWLVFSQHYIDHHFDQILKHANIIEQRLAPETHLKEMILRDNRINLQNVNKFSLNYVLINEDYESDLSKLTF